MAISNNDKEVLINGTATIPFRINIIQDNTIIKTLDEYSIVDLDYEDFRYVNTNSLVIGQFVARKITGNLDRIYEEFEIEDTELELQMGVSYNNNTTYYSLGNFLVTKPSNDDVKDKTTFEAMDYTKKFNIVFDGTTLQYPCTALQLATECCRQAGVELATTDFTNYDFEVLTNQYVEGDTCRKVMQDIGKLAYSWVRIDWDNKCYIDFDYGTTIDTYNIIENTNYYDLSLQKKVFGPVNRVVIGMQDVEGENAVIEDTASIEQYGVTELQIYDNNITYTPELRQLAINGATKLFGLTYTPLEINTTGHPWLIGNEKIEIKDSEGNSLYTYPWDRTIVYNGHIKTKLASKADTKIESEYRNYGDIESSVRRTRIVVDKQNQTITSLAENVGQYDSRISTIEQSIDEIEQSVEVFEDLQRDVVGYNKIHLENAIPGTPVKFIIRNAQLVFPSSNLYPKTTLFPKDSYLVVDTQEELSDDARFYKLPFTALYALNDVYDEFVIEDTSAYIIHRIGMRNDETLYVLDNEFTEDLGEVEIDLHDGDNYIYLYSFQDEQVVYEMYYLVHSAFTDRFATEAYVRSSIRQTAAEITLEIDQKTDRDEIVSKINLVPGEILLEGTVTANDNFKILSDGSIEAKNGSFSGDIFLGSGGKVIGGDGLLTNLQFNSVGIINGWSPLGFNIDDTENVLYQDLCVDYNIPNNFTISSAYLTLYTSKVMSSYMNTSTYQTIETTGTPKQLKLYKGILDSTYSVFWANGTSYFFRDNLSLGSEISNAFGSSTYTPSISSVGDVVDVTSIDLKNQLSTSDGNNQLIVRTSVAKPSNFSTTANRQSVAQNTGMARMVLNIIGYMST